MNSLRNRSRRSFFHSVATAAVAGGLALMPMQGAAETTVGVTSAVNPQAFGAAPGGTASLLSIGRDVVFNERITTNTGGLVQLLLLDGSTFTVSPNADLVIDKFIYDPASGTGELVASFSKGAMRFVGGKLSKNKGGVSVVTPVGTIGIRGGIANVIQNPGTNAWEFALVFGNELTFAGSDGTRRRVYEPGYSINVTGNAGGGAGASIGPTQSDSLTQVQSQLAGQPGSTGGAPRTPTNGDVAASDVPGSNSNNPPSQNIPLPPQRVLASTTVEEVATDSNDIQSQQTSDSIDQSIDDETYVPMATYFRVLSAGDIYEFGFGGSVTTPGRFGLVGGSTATDRAVSFRKEDGNYTGTVDGTVVDLPRYDVPGQYSVSGVTGPNGSLSGSVYVGADGLHVYTLFENADVDQPFYLFGGGVAPNVAVIEGGGLRSYRLLPDPQENLSVPFTSAATVGSTSGAAVSDLLIVEPYELAEDGLANVVQASLMISGQGANQRSLVNALGSGFYLNEGDNLEYGTGRRGSVRTSATEDAILYAGAIGTVSDPNGNNVFGANAENFVLGTDLSNNDSFFNDKVTGQAPERDIATFHIAELTGEVPLDSLTRSTRTLNGYSSAVIERRFLNAQPETSSHPDLGNRILVRSDGFGMSFFSNADYGFGGAAIQVGDIRNGDSTADRWVVGFGVGMGSSSRTGRAITSFAGTTDADAAISRTFLTNGSDGAAGFADDDRFAYLNNQNRDATFFVADTGAVVTQATSDNNPSSYLIGSDTVSGGTSFASPGATDCVCAFAEWGWWGTRMQAEDGANFTESGGERRDFVHLGTWVAGDVSDDTDLPMTGTASFVGKAVGNVVRQVGADTQQYIAQGRLDMGWDFSARNGTLSISDLDGMSVSGAMAADTLSIPENQFSGSLSGAGGLTGGAVGSFVQNGLDPAGGVIGNFDFANGTAGATGIFVGQNTPDL